jgi:hypothetical protein
MRMFKKRSFWVTLFVGAFLVPVLQLITYMEGTAFGSTVLAKVFFIPFSAWYFVPALVFGDRYFMVGIGAGPESWEGIALAMAFYVVAALIGYGVVGRLLARPQH